MPSPFHGTDRFEILSTLGRGAGGTVYEARDRARKMRVALKTLNDLDPELRYRFKREFRALSNVHDEHLVELYELFADADPWFFTMELIVGTDFTSYLRKSMRRSPSELPSGMRGRDSASPRRGAHSIPCAPTDVASVRTAFVQLCEGLEALHRRGLLHRDVKPSNVLVTAHGRVVLVDFGIVAELRSAISQHDLTATVGTPAYMAPEQGCGEAVSAATDWYAVGVMLFEQLTGRLPFEGHGLELIQAKLTHAAPRVRELVPSIPESLDVLCAALLAQDARQRPSFGEILRQLDGDARSVPSPALADASSAPFLGREQELSQLCLALDEVGPGHPLRVHVSGSSGMGKSALIEHFLDAAVARDSLVFSGRCCERESVPFKALDDVIDALALHLSTRAASALPQLAPENATALIRVFPALAQVPELVKTSAQTPQSLDSSNLLELRGRAVLALRALLRHLGKERPVIFAIDDAQWGDQDSAHLLAELLAPPDPPNTLVLLSYRREHEGRAPLLDKDAAVALRSVPIEPLTEARARTLAAHWLGTEPDDPAVSSIVSEAAGSPFLLGEFARHVRAVGVPAARLDLGAVLQARFAELDDAARRMLQALAVAARPLDPFLAARVSELAPEDGAAALRALRQAHLVRDSDARAGTLRIETFHDRVREALVSALDASDLRSQHERFVVALTERGSEDVEALYQHCCGAGQNAQAVEYAVLAAEAAGQSLAFVRSAELFEAARSLAAQSDVRVHGWSVARAEALACAGRRKDAGAAYVEAAANAPSKGARLALECTAVQQYLSGGHFDVGMRLAESTAHSLGVQLAPSRNAALLQMVGRLTWLRIRGTRFTERGEAEVPAEQLLQIDGAYRIGCGVGLTDPIRGSELFMRQMSLALKAGEIKRVAISLSRVCSLLGADGPSDYARRLIDQSTELAVRSGDRETLAVVTLGRGCIESLNGFWKPALVELERAHALFKGLGRLPTSEQRDTQSLLLVVRYWLGQMRELCTHVPAAVAETTQLGDAYARGLLTTSKPSLCWLAMNQPEHHAELTRTGVTSQARGDTLCIEHVLAMVNLMDNALYVGEPERAAARLAETLPAARKSLLLRMLITSTLVQDVSGRMALMMACLGRDARENRRLALKQASALERWKSLPFPTAIAVMLRAGEADAAGRAEDCVALYRKAAESFAAADMALHATVARMRLGQWLGGDQGTELCSSAQHWLREQGIVEPQRMANMMAPSTRN
jgi:serine/threonine protein kinase